MEPLHIEECPLVYAIHPPYFQRCMLAIFDDMVETLKSLWMIFFVFGLSFNICLVKLKLVLQHYEETNLVLN